MTQKKFMVKKMCVIGEAAVGKTSLIRRYVHNKYDDRYVATLGTKTSAKELQINKDDKSVYLKLQIWDVLGVRSFSKLQKKTYKGAKGAFIVLDITRKSTMYSFESWLLSLYKTAGEIPVVLLVNKNDLEPRFGRDEIEALISAFGFPYYLTSAKTGENVAEAFYRLGEMMVEPWEGRNLLPILEMSGAFDRIIEPEIEPGRKLTVYEVEDIMMARFCDLMEDPDIAMAIIRNQFQRTGVDFMNPSKKELARVMDYMIEAASNQIEPKRLERERKVLSDLIKLIG